MVWMRLVARDEEWSGFGMITPPSPNRLDIVGSSGSNFESIRDASDESPQTPECGPIEVQYDEMTNIVIGPANNEEM